jgi:hypothetical protein
VSIKNVNFNIQPRSTSVLPVSYRNGLPKNCLSTNDLSAYKSHGPTLLQILHPSQGSERLGLLFLMLGATGLKSKVLWIISMV